MEPQIEETKGGGEKGTCAWLKEGEGEGGGVWSGEYSSRQCLQERRERREMCSVVWGGGGVWMVK